MDLKSTLPLDDGCLFVDNSFLSTLQECTRACEYSRIRKRMLSRARPGLDFGSAGHLVLDHRYRKCGNTVVTPADRSEQLAILEEFYSTCNIPEDDFRNIDWAASLFIDKYNTRYQVEPFSMMKASTGEPLVEIPFAFPLVELSGIPIIFCGRIDVVVSWDDEVWIVDHKTTRYLTDLFWKQESASLQFPGYCRGYMEATGGAMPTGFCINAIRTATPPAKPRMSMDTWWEGSFQRYKDYITPEKVQEWEVDVLSLLDRFFFHLEKGYFPREKRSCVGKYGPCQFGDVCDLPIEQRDMMLMSDHYAHDAWTPLKPHGE